MKAGLVIGLPHQMIKQKNGCGSCFPLESIKVVTGGKGVDVGGPNLDG
jgi:hypothetical protein